MLHQRYPGLGTIAANIQRSQNLEVVSDSTFRTLKPKCLFIEDYLKANPRLPEKAQAKFISSVLGRASGPSEAKAPTTEEVIDPQDAELSM